MDTRYVNDFIVLAQKKNYLEASEDLYISQSSLSKHIMSLEKELGCKLFRRTTRRIELSEEGKLFLPYASEIISQERHFLARIKSRNRAIANDISLASNSQLSQYALYALLIQFKKRHPEIELNIDLKPHAELKQMLRNHQVDLIWIGETPEEEKEQEFTRICFGKESFVAVVSPKSPLAEKKIITLKELLDHEIFIQDNSSMEQQVFRIFCRQNHIAPRIISVPGGQSLVQTIISINGIGIMMLTPAKNYLSLGIKIIPIENAPYVNANLLYLKDSTISSASQKFLKFLQTMHSNCLPEDPGSRI